MFCSHPIVYKRDSYEPGVSTTSTGGTSCEQNMGHIYDKAKLRDSSWLRVKARVQGMLVNGHFGKYEEDRQGSAC